MQANLQITVNGAAHDVESASDTPLLYVLRNEMLLNGPRFGCGLAQCGSCSVLVDGKEIRSCVTPVSAVAGHAIVTLEGLSTHYAAVHKLPTPALHPISQAFIDEQAIQCGYCFNGMTIKAAELLDKNASPSDADIRTHMAGHLCRCGSYPRVLKAIHRAAMAMQNGAGK